MERSSLRGVLKMEKESGQVIDRLKEIATILLEIRNAIILAGLVGHKLASNAEEELWKLANKHKLIEPPLFDVPNEE